MPKQTKTEKQLKYLSDLQTYYGRLYAVLESANLYHWTTRFESGCAIVNDGEGEPFVIDFSPDEQTVGSGWTALNDLELRIEERVEADRKYQLKVKLREQALAKLTEEEREALR